MHLPQLSDGTAGGSGCAGNAGAFCGRSLSRQPGRGQGTDGDFERTYGKIERSPRQALYTPKEEPAQYHGKPDPAYDGEEYLLVDGYNIIFAWDELKTIARDNLDGARGQLMQHSQQLLRLSAVPADPGI